MTQAAAKTGQRELALRLMSAAVLIPFALFVVWSGGLLLAMCCVLFAAILAYEWVRMSVSPMMTIFVSLAIIPPAVGGVFGVFPGIAALILCAIIAGVTHPLTQERRTAALGHIYVAGIPLAMYALREASWLNNSPELWQGMAASLMIMGIVWGSDTAAFFTGRAIGGPSLTPESPSKTWSGAIGAVIFSAICGLLAAYLADGSYILWCVAGGVVSVLAQCGDLLESILKRRFGVKDSSGLLPGHGGLMDRVDGLGIVCAFSSIGFFISPSLVAQLGLTV